MNVPRRKDAAKRFKEMAQLAEEALMLDADGQTAQAQRNWSKVLPGAVDPPKEEDLKAELAAGLRKGNEWVSQGTGGMSVTKKFGTSIASTRAFGDQGPQTR